MSSFLGGRSALRGGCTQPCRRIYQNAGRKKNYFSMSDFVSLDIISEIRKLPIAAVKIEGRMKGPDYVGQVVKAYKLVMEASDDRLEESCQEASELLKSIPGRPITTGFITGNHFIPGLWETQNASGLKLGYLTPVGKGMGRITLTGPVKLLDRLRLAAEDKEGQAYKLRQMFKDGQEIDSAVAGETITLAIGEPDLPPPSSPVFKIGSGSLEKELLVSELVKRLKNKSKNYKLPQFKPVPANLTRERAALPSGQGRYQPLWLWLDGLGHIHEMLKFRPRKIILPLTAETVKELYQHRKMMASFSDLVFSLPPLLFGRTQEKIRKEAMKLIESGYRDFIISNLGQIPLLTRLQPGLKLWADHHVGVLNHLSGNVYHELGLAGVTLSLEIDQETLNKLSQASFPGGVLMYLYGRPALFSSRYRPPNLKRGPVVSQRGEKFWASEEGEAFILQSEHRVFIGGLLKSPKPRGFVGLIVDLRWEPNPVEAARRIRRAIDQGRGSPGLSFNFKRGLK
jgi:putative protease